MTRDAMPDTPTPLGTLLGALEQLERWQATGSPAAVEALGALRLAAATVRLRGELDAFSAHNLAVGLVRLTEAVDSTDPAARALREALEASAAPLERAWKADPDDLVVVRALVEAAAATGSPRTAYRWFEATAPAARRDDVSPALAAARARLLLRVLHAGRRAGVDIKDEAIAEAIDSIGLALARRPWHEPASAARMELLLWRYRRATGVDRETAWTALEAALRDHRRAFGPTAAWLGNAALALAEGVASSKKPAPGAVEAARARFDEALDHPGVAASVLVATYRMLDKAGVLEAEHHRHAAAVFAERARTAPPRGAEALRRARSRALEAAGDEAALLADAVAAIGAKPDAAGRQAAALVRPALVVATHLARAVERGTALPPVPAAVAIAAARILPDEALAQRLKPRQVAALLEALGQVAGESAAADLAARLASTGKLARQAAVARAIHAALRQGGRQDEALAFAEKAASGGVKELALEAARALLERGERLGDADALLKPLVARTDHPLAAEAQALRKQVRAHPRYADSLREELLAFEREVGVGSGKPLHLRVVYTADQYVLAEVQGAPAPAAYPHRHLRVLVRRRDLPWYVRVADLTKGADLFAPVRAEDDERKRGSQRVYWVAPPGAVPGWSDEAREARAAELVARFGLNTGAPVELRLEGRTSRGGALRVRPVGPGGELFPCDLRVPLSALAPGIQPDALRPGVTLLAPVDAEPDRGGGAGARRFHVRKPVGLAAANNPAKDTTGDAHST